MKKNVKNPLIKRIPRELAGDWRKYLVVCLFLILMIGFVAGMYVANGSMMKAIGDGDEKYNLEYGHFELKKKADDTLLKAIATGKKADVKTYYTEKARKELNDRFADEFDKEFDKEFADAFEKEYTEQAKAAIQAQGVPEAMAQTMVQTAVAQAKSNGTYDAAYTKAYDAAYQDAYDEAYDKAWDEVQDEIEDSYAEAEEKYELKDKNFKERPVQLYENFFRNEDEDYNADGKKDGTIRVYKKTEGINEACVLEGRLPENGREIAVDRMHADNVGIQVGDTIRVGGQDYEVVGLIAYVNYATLHEKSTDLIFDALKFDVAMLTEEGFDRLQSSVHYCYAWRYKDIPADTIEEKKQSDDFMKAMLTQVIVKDNELEEYLPRYANPAIQFAPDDITGDESISAVLLDILIVIIAFIFAVTISNTITKESQTIGTLRASGYTRTELIVHYLSMPVIVTLIGAVVGNILGYTVLKGVVVGMYYNSYSLPTYVTVWNPEAFVKTTVTPVAIMLVVNLLVIVRMMRHTPLQFLRHDLKKTKRKKAMRLPRWNFMSRFRLRIMFQNKANYLILFIGIFFVMTMLAMAVGMPDTLNYYKENVSDMMFAKYQYILKSYEDADGDVIHTKNRDAEPFLTTSLQRKAEALDEEISVYGVQEDSRYVKIPELKELKENEVFISTSFAQKYHIEAGDTIRLDEKYENKSYSFTVKGEYEKSQSLSVFMSNDAFRKVFDCDKEEFSGYLSNTKITDIDEDEIATVVTKQDITKMCDQLDHSMGSTMQYFEVLCVVLAMVLIYLLTKLIIEKNEVAISMTKILGYTNGEIARLYLLSTTILVLLSDVISVGLGVMVMRYVWSAMLATYSGWFEFVMEPVSYVKMFGFVLIGYVIVMLFDFRRIKKIPMDQALKNVE